MWKVDVYKTRTGATRGERSRDWDWRGTREKQTACDMKTSLEEEGMKHQEGTRRKEEGVVGRESE